MAIDDSPPRVILENEEALDLKRPLSLVFILAWGVVALTVVGTVAGAHLLTLPAPSPLDARLASAMRAGETPTQWTMMHILRDECRCSQRIVAHLVSRRALAGVVERVVLVGADGLTQQKLEAAGFGVVLVAEEQLRDDYGVEAVPLLTVATPRGEIRYVGGYTSRKQGPLPAEESILRRLQGGESVEALPLFGCATSQRLKDATDPLGVR